MPEKLKILYDGNCIVCDREIAHYSRIRPEAFELVDISAPEFDPSRFGLERAAVDLNLHVLTEAGEVRIGVDAFACIWDRIPGYAIAGRLIRLPVVYSLAKIGYAIFAGNRHLLPKKKHVVGH